MQFESHASPFQRHEYYSGQHDLAAEVDLESEFGEHGSFYTARAVGLFLVWGIDDLDVVGFVPRHHLIAADAFKNRVHDGPLRSGFAPAPLGFFLGKFDDLGDTQISMQPAIHDEDAAPNDMAGFRDAFERATTKPEIDRKSTRLNPVTSGYI